MSENIFKTTKIIQLPKKLAAQRDLSLSIPAKFEHKEINQNIDA